MLSAQQVPLLSLDVVSGDTISAIVKFRETILLIEVAFLCTADEILEFAC